MKTRQHNPYIYAKNNALQVNIIANEVVIEQLMNYNDRHTQIYVYGCFVLTPKKWFVSNVKLKESSAESLKMHTIFVKQMSIKFHCLQF